MMALPGHSSSPRFTTGPGSPPRQLNGYPDSPAPYIMYGPHPRPMPPPSPQHFPPRYSQGPPPPQMAHTMNHTNEPRAPPPPHKRPGSSMSISSMLGSEPEKPQDSYYSRPPMRQNQINGPSMSVNSVMSPPQYPPRPDYNYKPRAQTPDKTIDTSSPSRYRSGSGSLTQRPGPFYDTASNFDNRPPPPRYGDPGPFHNTAHVRQDEAAERARRTSISGLLQRPESEPQQPQYGVPAPQHAPAFARTASSNGDVFGIHKPVPPPDRPVPSAYDTRPPPFSNLSRPTVPPTSTPNELPKQQDRRDAQSMSPNLRRAQPTNEPRSLANILNATIENGTGPQHMMRQDSVQSQSDRSAFGDRYRPRAFSPFAGSVASQTMSVTSVPIEDQARKGSDELSQHRQILGLAAEAKRGRFSPVPQAVQGAQAQTPVPDSGIKMEHGRVFSGLGGGMGNSNSANSSRPGLAASPFKANDASARLSEENLMKISKSSSGVTKRTRKYDDEARAESDVGTSKKGRGGKRSKYGHIYRVDMEENPRRTPLSGTPLQRTLTPTTKPSQLQHHQSSQRQVSASEQAPLFKPKKTIRISSIISSAKRLPRRHLGAFKYDPDISKADISRLGHDKFDISIRPNLLPCFNQVDKVNCTYTVRVPKLWLRERERRLVCQEAYVWGSGIYTDDSDVLCAAMHTGFIKSVPPESVDHVLLDRVVKEQNAKIEGLVDVPERPVEPEASKDAIITLLVLQNLERYEASSRFGICSRPWPEKDTKTGHDGVSFAVLRVEFVSGGVEARRMGRTGASKRARIKEELKARMRGEKMRLEMIEKVKRKKAEGKKKVVGAGPTSAPAVKEAVKKPLEKMGDAVEGKKDVPALDVGQAPGEWLRQLEVSAVE